MTLASYIPSHTPVLGALVAEDRGACFGNTLDFS